MNNPPILPMNVDTAPVTTLTPYPGNPRIGNVQLLKQSLTTHGQYRPLVVQRSTGHILAGNNTYHAACALHWEHVAVHYVDVDDDQARRIVLIDNRANDLAGYDDQLLTDLLASVDTLDGTGYDPDSPGDPTGSTTPTPPPPPDDFPSFDDDLATDYRCPHCSYEWSGAPK